MKNFKNKGEGKEDWITPPHITKALGKFDLDPCVASPQPFRTARRMFTKDDDGLSKEWSGRVWLNPPYGQQTGKWLARLAEHNDGIALVFGRYDTKFFKSHVWPKAHSMLLLTDRLKFYTPQGQEAEGTAGAPSVLIAYNAQNGVALRQSKLAGKLIEMSKVIDNPKRNRKGFSASKVRGGLKKIARVVRHKNVGGYIDANGNFRPIRASEDYNEFLAGDFNERKRRKKPLESLTLSEFVRREGGMKDSRDHNYAGELRRLSPKETRTTGLINSKRGKTPEHMAESAREMGFRVSSNPNKFIEQVEGDVYGTKKVYHPEREWITNPARAKQMRSTPLFDLFAQEDAKPKAPARATRKRKAHLRVYDRHSKQEGTVLKVMPGGWLKVKLDNATVPHLIQRSELRLANPFLRAGSDAPGDIYREFHGKEPSGETITLKTRTGIPAEVDVLGSLVEIRLISEDAPLAFEEGQAWLGAYGTGGRRRLVIGLTKLFKMPAGYQPGKEYDYGEVDNVVYKTSKPHIYKAHKTGKEAQFIHTLGEEGGRKPHLILKDGIIFFRGGDYTIEAAGIKD